MKAERLVTVHMEKRDTLANTAVWLLEELCVWTAWIELKRQNDALRG